MNIDGQESEAIDAADVDVIIRKCRNKPSQEMKDGTHGLRA